MKTVCISEEVEPKRITNHNKRKFNLMQSLNGYLPLSRQVIARRRKIVLGERDLAASATYLNQTTDSLSDASAPVGDEAKKGAKSQSAKKNSNQNGRRDATATPNSNVGTAIIPSAAEIEALKKATVFARDGYVFSPNDAAAGVDVWIPKGWKCEETQPAWNTTVLYFKPAKEAVAAEEKKRSQQLFSLQQEQLKNAVGASTKAKGKGKGGNGKKNGSDKNSGENDDASSALSSALPPPTFISSAAAADPVACLRLTIQDLYSEIGEQSASEYVSDVVSNIYKEQTRFVATKYKVNGPKILLDQKLPSNHRSEGRGGGGRKKGASSTSSANGLVIATNGNASCGGGATSDATTTDDDGTTVGGGFQRYQKMFSKNGGFSGNGGVVMNKQPQSGYSSTNSDGPPMLMGVSSASSSPTSPATAMIASYQQTKSSSSASAQHGSSTTAAAGHSNSNSSNNAAALRYIPSKVSAFANILSYTTNTIIRLQPEEVKSSGGATAKRVQVASTSFVAVRSRFMYSFELQSSLANHVIASSSSEASFADPALACTSWMDCFLQMAQVMRFKNVGGSSGRRRGQETEEGCSSTSESDSASDHGSNHGDDDTCSEDGDSPAKRKQQTPSASVASSHLNMILQRRLPKGVIGSDPITLGPHCFVDVQFTLASSGTLLCSPYFSVKTPSIWTPSLLNPRIYTLLSTSQQCLRTEVLPLISFDSNSEAFPAAIQLFAVRTSGLKVGAAAQQSSSASSASVENVSLDEAAIAQLTKLSLTEAVAALGLQRSYTSSTVTIATPSKSATIAPVANAVSSTSAAPPAVVVASAHQKGVAVVTITPCIVAPSPNTAGVNSATVDSVSAAMRRSTPPPAGTVASSALNSRRFVMCPMSIVATPVPATMAMLSIVAVEVPHRRNMLRTPISDLAGTVASFLPTTSAAGVDSTLCVSSLFGAISAISSSSSEAVSVQLSRRLVLPSMDYSVRVGDGCQCLATALRPEVASIAVRPAHGYANQGDEGADGKGGGAKKSFITISRSADETLFVKGVDVDEGIDEGFITIAGSYPPRSLAQIAEQQRKVHEGDVLIEKTPIADPDPSQLEADPTVFAGFPPRPQRKIAAVAVAAVAPQVTDMNRLLTKSVAELACELAEEEEGLRLSTDEVIVSEWLSMVGNQSKGMLKARDDVTASTPPKQQSVCTEEGEAEESAFASCPFLRFQPPVPPNVFVPNAIEVGNSKDSVGGGLAKKNGQDQKVREWLALQAHLRSATDPASGAFVTMQTVFEPSSNRGVVIKAVSPNFTLFRKHRGLLMNTMLPSFEFL